jgi:hypothetical protein
MRFLAVLAVLFSAAVGASAQVDVKLEFDQSQFLAAETAPVTLRIANFTGGPLKLGDRPGWLQFSVENVNGTVVSRLSDVEETGSFVLKPSTRGTMRFDLTPLFKLDQIGRYTVTATVVTGGADNHVVSAPAEFEIMRGVTLWEREFGVTGSPGIRRKYVVQQANYLKRARIYACITDVSGGVTYKVVPLGTVVSFNPPQMSLDAQNRLNVLHQYGADDYLHHRIDADGAISVRNIYGSRSGRPELGVNDEGDVAVINAKRKPGPGDIPGPETAKAGSVKSADVKTADPKP